MFGVGKVAASGIKLVAGTEHGPMRSSIPASTISSAASAGIWPQMASAGA